MKKLAGLVIILAVLVLGSYYVMGFFTEKTIRKNIDVINQSNGLYAEIEQYKRGWFCSEANLKWKLHVPERTVKDANGQSQAVPAQDYQMDMPLKVYHGPVIIAAKSVRFGMGFAQSTLAFPEKYNAQFDNLFTKESIKPHLDLSIFVSYLNRSTFDLTVPTFNVIAKDNSGQLTWMGLNSKTSVTSGADKIEGELTVDGMNFNKTDTKVSLGKITSDYDLHQTLGGMYLGGASFSLPLFTVTTKDQKVFEISEFATKTDSDISSGLFHMDISASLKSVFAAGKVYGPGEFELSLRNLDGEVLTQINEQATAIQNGTDVERQQAMLAMLPQLPKLFGKGAVFEISKLKMQLPEGLIEGTMSVSLPEGNTDNPFGMIQKIKGKAKLVMPMVVVKQLMQQSTMQQMNKRPELQQALVQQMQGTGTAAQPAMSPEQLAAMQVDKQLSNMQQNGLIVVEGTNYSVDIVLEEGKFTINGKPYDPLTMRP